MDDPNKRKQETKRLLKLLKKALTGGKIERITITLRPDKKPKQ